VPIEAGACGLLVVATDSGGPRETVLNMVTGLLVPPNADSWAYAIEQLLFLHPEERKDMSQRAKEHVREQFSLSTLGREMEEACREAVGMGSVHNQIGDRFIWAGVLMMLASGMAIVATWWAA